MCASDGHCTRLPWGDTDLETGMIISSLSKIGDILQDRVTDISLASHDNLIYGDNDLYSEMIISKKHSFSQMIEKKKRY